MAAAIFILFLGFLQLQSNAGAVVTPRITEHPLNMTVARNEPVTLGCKAEEANVIEWFKDGERVTTAPEDPQSHRILLPDGSLFFLRAMQSKKQQDAGVYWCLASNENGVARSHNATLEIAYLREDFRLVPRDTNVAAGEDATLHCVAPKGHPEPVIRWKKDGEALDLTSSNRVRIDDSGSLVIQKVRKSDAGRYQCSAKNLAATRDSRPVRLQVHEPPFFAARPSDTSSLAGDDVFLPCEVGGDPHPDIHWRRHNKDIDVAKVKIVRGKGLRIESVHPDDEGTYSCDASNVMGTISATAVLGVLERPVITVKPQAIIQRAVNDSIHLDCVATGKPKPAVFWSIEGVTEMIMAGAVSENVRVSADGSLSVERPRVEDSGQYVCTALNAVGASIARSHLVVFDPRDFEATNASHSATYEATSSRLHDEEARLALLERTVTDTEAFALGPTSIRVKWAVSGPAKYVEGFHVRYRPRGARNFASMTLYHSEATTYDVHRLKAYSSYEVFVQPFHQAIPGLPSPLQTVQTHPTEPASAPRVIQARMVNASAAYLAWAPVPREHHNGVISGYQIVVRHNSTVTANVTVPSDQTELIVVGMSPGREYSVTVAARNSIGSGPFSDPAQLYIDAFERDSPDIVGYTWLIALIGSLIFMLFLMSGVMLYYRRRHSAQKSMGYLAANTTDDYQCQQINVKSQPLWIDRRWNGTDHDSNSSEKKLLNQKNYQNNSSSSENEYAYIDRHNLSTFSHQPYHQQRPESPEPYATTDIFKQQKPGSSRFFPLSVTPMLHPRSTRSNVAGGLKRDTHSCDDIAERSYAKVSLDKIRQNKSLGRCHVVFNKPETFKSEENVISPHYLFQHPSYYGHFNRYAYRVTPTPMMCSRVAQPQQPIRLTDGPMRLASDYSSEGPILVTNDYSSVNPNMTAHLYPRVNNRNNGDENDNPYEAVDQVIEPVYHPQDLNMNHRRSVRVSSGDSEMVAEEAVTRFDDEYFVDSDPESYLDGQEDDVSEDLNYKAITDKVVMQ